jgi:hypothetical protein
MRSINIYKKISVALELFPLFPQGPAGSDAIEVAV